MLPLTVGALILAASGCSHTASPAAPSAAQTTRTAAPQAAVPTGTAGPVAPDPHVGAVFLGATDMHTCAAAVLHSKAGDLIVTAAHCLAAGNDTSFVPGFSGTGGPAGTWTVDLTYLDSRWLATHDPQADYAIARVHRDGAGSLESVVGPGLALGTAPRPGTVVTVVGYPLGTGGTPLGCSGPTALAPGGFPSLRCAGFVDGTSGAPWLRGNAVVGVIGGLHGGGCFESDSYSAPFNAGVAQLFARAEAGGPADTPPAAFVDDC